MSQVVVRKHEFKSRQIRDDPWTFFTRLREQGPVVRIAIPFIGATWAATNYEAASIVFKEADQFVRDSKNAGRSSYASIQWLLPRVFDSLINNMLGADGEKHRRLRSIVDKAFTLRNIEGMSQRIKTLANEQMDVAESVAKRDGEVDLIEHFARPFPLTVICELLGLPLEDRSKFRQWFAPMSTVTSVFGIWKFGGSLKRVTRYLREQFEIVSREPRDGLMSELVRVEHEGESLNADELLAMVFLLFVAGHETTVHLISNAVHVLLQHPDVREELQSDWALCDSVIDETMRYCSPLQMAKPRFVTSDMEFYGQQLRRGEMITPIIASANLDPEQFENPFDFDIHRERIYHLSFGSGPHTCLGMKLARVETHCTLKALFERWPKLQAAFDVEQPDWSARLATRGMKTMMLRG